MHSRVVQPDDCNSVADECEWRAIASLAIFPSEPASWAEKFAKRAHFAGFFYSDGRAEAPQRAGTFTKSSPARYQSFTAGEGA